MKDNTPPITPIQKKGDIYLKRDDHYRIAGVCGGKVRTCWHMATMAGGGCKGLVTAGARNSLQAQIVARLAARLGIRARCHLPSGAATVEMEDMRAHGAEIIQHKAGYNNVLVCRAKADHKKLSGWQYIPFGMEDRAAIRCTAGQVRNIPTGVKRIIVPIGGGMSAAGVLHGLRDQSLAIPVVGVRVGADPTNRLNAFAPFAWREHMRVVDAGDYISYHRPVEASIGGVVLDPYYEAKCVKYIEPGDLLWIVGVRAIEDK